MKTHLNTGDGRGSSASGMRSGAESLRGRYLLPDLSVGRAGDDDPLEAYSWQDLRETVYEPPRTPVTAASAAAP